MCDYIMSWERTLMQQEITGNGQKVTRGRTWTEAHEPKEKGILYEPTPYGYSDWFYIYKEESIWWIYYDSSDGGIWTTTGPLVTGYFIGFATKIAGKLRELEEQQRQQRLKKNNYAKLK